MSVLGLEDEEVSCGVCAQVCVRVRVRVPLSRAHDNDVGRISGLGVAAASVAHKKVAEGHATCNMLTDEPTRVHLGHAGCTADFA